VHRIKESGREVLFFVQFKGKKIGIASTAAQLGNTIVLNQIERMITAGAELLIIITDAASDRPAAQKSSKRIIT
jgi:electron transfer flavoprotein alpha/beta subunit